MSDLTIESTGIDAFEDVDALEDDETTYDAEDLQGEDTDVVSDSGLQPRGRIDLPLLVAVFVLVGIGTVAVYTGSSWRAQFRMGSDVHFVLQHLSGIAIGLIALVVAMRIDFRRYRPHARLLLLGTAFLLAATRIPGIGRELNGAYRWLDLKVFLFQPAELAKVVICIFMAYSIERRQKDLQGAGTLLTYAMPLAFFVVPLIAQPDFGSSAIVTAIVAVMLFLGGARYSHIVMVGVLAVIGVLGAVFSESYRMARVLTWFNPWEDQSGSSSQLINAWVALARGGLSGTGFGEGYGMFGFVPEMHNDFVAAVVGEEFGWYGFLVFVLLFGVIAWRGFTIAARCKDLFGSYLAFALTTLITGQALINLGVVTGLFPTKGLTLPFVSFGRSSLIIMLFVVGMLLNISQNNPDVRSARAQHRTTTFQETSSRRTRERWFKERLKELRSLSGRRDDD